MCNGIAVKSVAEVSAGNGRLLLYRWLLTVIREYVGEVQGFLTLLKLDQVTDGVFLFTNIRRGWLIGEIGLTWLLTILLLSIFTDHIPHLIPVSSV